jgi:YVTN family beta-propeller protein
VKRFKYILLACCLVLPVLAGCGLGAGGQGTALPASPQGRMAIVNQDSNTLSVIDVATDKVIATVPTGAQPHHVLAAPDGRELWVTLYKENRLQVFDTATLQELASVDVGAPTDDLTFSSDGARLYTSSGSTNAIVVVDRAARKVLGNVPVGRTPHGVKVRPDDKELYVTNTGDNTVSIVTLEGAPQTAAHIRAGASPFEVTFSPDGTRAYISNFLGNSISIIDTATRAIVGTIRAGRQPAMLNFVPGNAGELLWVANTGQGEVWAVDPSATQPVQRIPVGQGVHGVVYTPSGKVYVTNTNDATVSVIEVASMAVSATIGVGTNPNGLTFVPLTE